MPRGNSFDALPLRLSNIIQAPEPVPVAPALSANVSAAPLQAAKLDTAPSLSLLNELALTRANLLRPDLTGVFRPQHLIPRSQLSVPVCRNTAAPSQPALLFSTLLEEPAPSNPQAFCYLPHYRLAVADTAGGQQFRVRLENDGQGGKLTVHLQSYPDPAIGASAGNARPIDIPVAVELRYPRLIGGQTVWDAWAFQEIAGEPGGFQAVLRVDFQSLPQLHLALTTAGTTLVVRRTLSYAIGVASESGPVYAKPAGIRVDAMLRRRPPDDGGDIVFEPPYNDDPAPGKGGGIILEPPPTHEELFTICSSAVEDALACAFPEVSYRYIFQDGAQTSGQGLDLAIFTKQWQGRQYSYYQDSARPWRFFYLPDAFKIARQEAVPRVPAIKLSTSNGQVTMTYAAAPYTDPKRLEDAARQLSADIPPGTQFPADINGPRFVPLTTVKATFRLALPGAGGADGPLVERPNVGLDFNNPARGLPGGIYDTITMPLNAFLQVFDALCSSQGSNPAHSAFWGEVDVTLGDTPQLPIPFVACLNDLVGELFSYGETELPAPEYPDLIGACSTLTNVIESPVRIDQLPATLHRSGNLASETRAVLTDPARQPIQLPITLAPGESLKLVVTPETVLPGDGPCDALFSFDAVAALPDPEKVLDAIVDPNVPMSQVQPVAIKVPRGVFGHAADSGGALYAVSVHFPGRGEYGQDVDFDITASTNDEESNTTTSEIITKTVPLYMPARGFLLHQSDAWNYAYGVTLRRAGGDVAGESGTRSGTSFWPKVA